MNKFFRALLLIVGLFFSSVVAAQSINQYQYIVVPIQFNFQKQEHQYDLNRLTQFMFNKYNFKAILEGEEFPEDFNICESLQLLMDSKGLLKTTVTYKLRDCRGKIVFESIEGESRDKDFHKAYNGAIRNLFKDPRITSHKFIPKAKTVSLAVKTPVVAVPNKLPIVNTPVVTNKIPEKVVLAPTDLQLELRGKQYAFKPVASGYEIYNEGSRIGVVVKSDTTNYTIDAGSLSGTGYFDDFGNFVLKRINPANQKEIKDTMVRVN